MIVETIKQTLKKNPNILFPYGKINNRELKKELNKYEFKFPKELILFWNEFGGGDLFEVETMLSPIFTSDALKENIIEINNYYLKQGLDSELFVFETNNAQITTFNKKTHEIFVLHIHNLILRNQFKDIKQWFEYFWLANI